MSPLPFFVRRSFVLLALTSACRSGHSPLPTSMPTGSDRPGAMGAMTEQAPPQQPGLPEFLPPPAPPQPTATRISDLVHTKLDVRFDYAKQYLYGTAIITLRPHFYPQTTLRLDAKQFLIEKVALLDAKGAEKPLAYTYADLENLLITLDRTYKAGETYRVLIQYTARPNERKAGGSDAITSDKGLYFINPDGKEKNKPRQIWTQGETQSNSCWFPTIDRPNQKMTQEIAMTVESRYKTLSNGLLISSKKNPDGTRTDTWKQDKPHAPYLVMMAVGDFAVIHDTWRGKAVDYYVEPKYAATARATFGHTPAMIEFISKKLGVDYPWDKYSQIVVRDYVSGAMENTSATLHTEGLQQERRELPDKDWDDYIFHELFHHWFGDLVTCESWSNLPLNESFANYSELLWAEHRFGPDGAGYIQRRELEQYLAEAEGKQVPLIRLRYQQREDMFDSHSYAKGGRVLHLLRSVVGDEAFFASLKLYLERHKFKTAEISDLRLAFEEVTGQDLNWFFDQYFLRPGHADLTVSHVFQRDSLRVTVEQRQDSTFTPVYTIPVKLAAWVNGTRREWPVTLRRARQTFTFAVPAAPELVLFDADGVVVGTVAPEQDEAVWRYQFFHAGTYAARLDALQHCAERLGSDDAADRAVVLTALRDPHWYIRQTAAERLDKFKGEALPEVREALRAVAQQDADTGPRAAAMHTLAQLGDAEASAPIFRRALADTTSSYRIIGAALSALVETHQDEDLEPLVRGFERSQNIEIVQALADYYAAHPSADRLTWFNRQLDGATGVLAYSLTQQYGIFLLQLAPDLRADGIAALDILARTSPLFYVRLGAYQALFGLTETSPQVQPLLEQIRGQENDPRVQRFYEMLK